MNNYSHIFMPFMSVLAIFTINAHKPEEEYLLKKRPFSTFANEIKKQALNLQSIDQNKKDMLWVLACLLTIYIFAPSKNDLTTSQGMGKLAVTIFCALVAAYKGSKITLRTIQAAYALLHDKYWKQEEIKVIHESIKEE